MYIKYENKAILSTNPQYHAFNSKSILNYVHVDYYKHLVSFAKVHLQFANITLKARRKLRRRDSKIQFFKHIHVVRDR